MEPQEFKLEKLSQLSKKEIAKRKERKAHAEWVEGYKKRKKTEEEERAEDLKSLAERDKKAVAKSRAGRQELEFNKAISERIKEAEEEERKRDIEEMRKKIAPKEKMPEEEPRELYEVLPAEEAMEKIQIPDQELDEDFTKLEKEWFAKEPEEKKEIIKNTKELTELFYRHQMDRLHAQYPEKYPSGEEYIASSDTLTYFDQRKQQIELELKNKFNYDVLKGGWLARFKIKRKLDPADNERFDKLLKAYNNTDKSYRERFKEYTKKFGEAIELITPRGKNIFADRNKHPELGPPKFY